MFTSKSFTLLGLLLAITFPILSQQIQLTRVEPPNWWVGMENENLQLLVHGKNIAETQVSLKYPGVKLMSTTKLESNNYLFLNLHIAPQTNPGNFDLIFSQEGKEQLVYSYTLYKKKARKQDGKPTVNASDVMYLITPDRFANGDSGNDNTDDTIEKMDRNNPDGRHGGDIRGIINHLDYISDLGVTTLWLNPFLENDQPKYSYHGYGISDFYKTDSRFGSNQDFLELVDKCHQKDLKMVMDQVFNHCGAGHWWMDDLPSSDWLNQWPQFTRSAFINLTISDPYRSEIDHKLHTQGWFDTNLPDLNQKNPFVETYLIQNSIWWIEYGKLDGIRMDTYPYPAKETMARWVEAVLREYPNFYLVGETWESDAATVSYWNKGRANKDGYDPKLQSVSDYPLYYAMLKAFGPENNIFSLYQTLAYDYLYSTPFNNKIFNGNHDQPRPFNQFKQNKDKVKLSMAFVLTTRGIPQIYYGDELLFDGPKPDGRLRTDFPGGWEGDKRNLFDPKNRNEDEAEMFDFVKKILDWRKGAKEVHEGSLKHYKPFNEEVYVYFRSLENASSMIILNNGDHTYENFDLRHYRESLEGYSTGTDIVRGQKISSLNSLSISPQSAYIIQLEK